MSDEKPLLYLPSLARVDQERDPLPGGYDASKVLRTPGRAEQQRRLEPRFEAIRREFDQQTMLMSDSADQHAPEKVLVLETAINLPDFYRAVARVEELQWLAEPLEGQLDSSETDIFFEEDTETGERTGKVVRGYAYLLFASANGMNELLRIWTRWQNGEGAEHGLGRFHKVFEHLVDIRRWSNHDRMRETGVLENWRYQLEYEPNEKPVPCEIELWFRHEADDRSSAEHRVKAHISRFGGEVIHRSEIPEIRYHALLAHFPTRSIDEAVRASEQELENVGIAHCEAIQFLHPVVQAGFVPPVVEDEHSFDAVTCPQPLTRFAHDEPIRVALFDGLPLQGHRALKNRLSVDDPDDTASNYPIMARVHATSMASLILWGDLGAKERTPLVAPIYSRPILNAHQHPFDDSAPFEERLPEDKLVVDTIFHAVRRLFVATSDEAPAAPKVAVINLSIGIKNREFVRSLSPLARLVDWLAWEHQVLFVVSAGNHRDPVDLGADQWAEGESASCSDAPALFRSISDQLQTRRLYSPAESINCLTVGAVHDEALSDEPRSRNIVDIVPRGYPSPLNALGAGFMKAIKPDLLAPGGRAGAVGHHLRSDMTFRLARTSTHLGQVTAAPGPHRGDLTHLSRSCGTSNATAMATRSAAQIIEAVELWKLTEPGETLAQVPSSLWAKCLLVHSANWHQVDHSFETALTHLFGNENRQRKFELSRFLGFGAIDPKRVMNCTDRRVTALGSGILKKKSHIDFHFPIPVALSGKTGIKEITATLAWFSPVNLEHAKWRKAKLYFKLVNDQFGFGSNDAFSRRDSDHRAVLNGTVHHEVFSGESALVIPDSNELRVRVSCAEFASGLSENIPFALAVTLEVDDGMGIDIYQDVAERLAASRARQIPLPIRQR